MIPTLDTSRVRRVLAIGAHSDDVEIGCGGALLRLLDERPGLHVTYAIFCGDETRRAEAKSAASLLLQKAASVNVILHGLRDAFLPYEGPRVKELFEQLKAEQPDLVFTHFRDDLHQDHKLLNQLTWNTFRNHAVLEYEIHKFDADLARPNVYVTLNEDVVSRKLAILSAAFGSQRSKQWFDEETFRGLMRIRGVECASPTRYAEAFHGRKITW
jgi:LmbE family N-acetylglucosaminyl deacetylase